LSYIDGKEMLDSLPTERRSGVVGGSARDLASHAEGASGAYVNKLQWTPGLLKFPPSQSWKRKVLLAFPQKYIHLPSSLAFFATSSVGLVHLMFDVGRMLEFLSFRLINAVPSTSPL
jgi:hypothetical protein